MSRGELGERGFVRLHGFHGRGVGNISGVPWRVEPDVGSFDGNGAGQPARQSSADAVFLTADELLGEVPVGAAELAAFRRARRDEYRTLELPTTFVGMPTPSTAPAEADRSIREISGVPGSAGTASGPARVIVDLDDAGTLESGEVLVCRSTDPAWVAAMALWTARPGRSRSSSGANRSTARERRLRMTTTTSRLHGKTIIVTGSTKGLGEAMVRRRRRDGRRLRPQRGQGRHHRGGAPSTSPRSLPYRKSRSFPATRPAKARWRP